MRPRMRYTQGSYPSLVNRFFDFLRAHSPAQDEPRFTDAYWRELDAEFGGSDRVTTFLMPFLFMAGIFLWLFLKECVQGPGTGGHWTDIFCLFFGLGFGMVMGFGLIFISSCLRGRSVRRLLDHSAMMHAIPATTQLKIFLVPSLGLLVLGVLGLYLPVP